VAIGLGFFVLGLGGMMLAAVSDTSSGSGDQAIVIGLVCVLLSRT
jgi:hypothetical protein